MVKLCKNWKDRAHWMLINEEVFLVGCTAAPAAAAALACHSTPAAAACRRSRLPSTCDPSRRRAYPPSVQGRAHLQRTGTRNGGLDIILYNEAAYLFLE